MIALGMCLALTASSLNLGGTYGKVFQVQAAEFGVPEKVSEKPEGIMLEEASQVLECIVPQEPAGDSDGTAQKDIPQVQEDAVPNGTSQLLENEPAGELPGKESLGSEGEVQDGFFEPAGIEPEGRIQPFAESDGMIAIDETNFPDPYFREYLLGALPGYEFVEIDADGDGMLSKEERDKVTYISIQGKPIRDFTGISCFPNLEEFQVVECLVASVDLSGNAEVKDVYMHSNQNLVSVDLSGNAKLTDVSLNYNEKMERVGLSGCIQLINLSVYGGAVSGLDLSGCAQLESLDCGSNQLEALDLSSVPQLKSLRASYNQLDVLNLSLNQNLEHLECNQNHLKKLDITGILNLGNLYCSDNKLEELNVGNNRKLKNINCNSNPLRKLDISQNLKLEILDINGTYITALDTSANEFLRLNDLGWHTAQIVSVAEQIEDGRWLLDLSSQEGFQPDKLLFEGADISGAAGVTEQGIVWEENPAQNGDVNISIDYDLSNGSFLDGKVIRCNYTLRMLPEGYDKTYVDLTADNFPDEAFRNFLKMNYDQDDDGKFQPGMISRLSIYEAENLANLAGLEFFKALTDLTVEGSPNLAKLDVSKNEHLSYLSLFRTSIHTLDLRNNPNMSELHGDLQLASLYVAEDNVGFSYYSGTSITATAIEENSRFVLDMSEYGGLDMKRITGLSDGEVDGNKIYWNSAEEVPIVLSYNFIMRGEYKEGMEYFGKDVLRVMFSLTNNAPEMPEGKEVALTGQNFPSSELLNYLKETYDSDNTGKVNTAEVRYINLGGAKITSMEGIEKLNCLQTLEIWNAPLRSLNLLSNTVLTSLSVTGSSLTDICITECPYLEYVNLSGNSLTNLDVSQNKILPTLNIQGNSLISLDVSQNKSLKDLNVNENAIKSLDLSGNSNLEVLSCSYNPAMVSLDFPVQKRKMTKLHILGSSVQDLQIDGMPNLTVLEIGSNGGGIKELDLSGNTKLQHLAAENITLHADWTKMVALKWVEIYQTYFPGVIESPAVDGSNSDITLKKVDLSNAANLQHCHIRMDSLGTLDVHGCANLQDLSVGGRKLHTLNILGCTALSSLDCSYNQLQTLDTSSCAALKSLNCSNNNLQALDIRNNGALQNLYCQENNLSTVDTSKNAALKWFECSGNPIVSLDLSNYKAMLSDLICRSASLTSLDVGEHAALKNVSLEEQELRVSEGGLQPVSGLAKASAPSAAQDLRGVGAGSYLLRLDKYGNFDPGKVKNLTSGTAVANGIMWESKDAVPDAVTYEYDISNNYKLAGRTMPVKIVLDGGVNGSILGTKRPLSTCTVTLSTKSYYYTGGTKEPKVVVKDRGNTLKHGKDYILNYKNNINAGKASVYLEGIGNYAGSVKKTFTIKKTQQKIRCTKSFQKTYSSKAFSLNAKRAPGNGKLSYSSSDKKVATVSKNGKVTLKGTGIATITIKAASTKNYKPTSLKVKVTVKPAKVAVASLKTIKGKKLSIKWKKAPNATGYEIQYSTDKKFKKGVKQKKITKGKATSCTLTKIKDNKNYYVRIRAYKTVKVKGKKQTLKGAWGTVRGTKKGRSAGESSEIQNSNQQNKIIQQMENRSK